MNWKKALVSVEMKTSTYFMQLMLENLLFLILLSEQI